MKYKWNIHEIRENIKILEQMKKDEIDIENIKNIDSVIDIYIEMLNNYNNKKIEQDIFYNLNYSIDNLKTSLQVLSYYNQSIDPKIIDIIIESYKIFHKFYYENQNNNVELINPILTSNNNDIRKITENFFIEKTTPELAEKAIKFLNEKGKIHINFTKQESDYGAITLLDCILNKKYIYLARRNRLTELRALPHELFHYLFSDFNDYQAQESNMYFSTEIEGNLANILFGEYFYEINNSEFKNFFNQLNLLSYESQVTDLIVRDATIKTIKENNKIRLNKLNKIINNYNLSSFSNKNELLEYLASSHESLIKYTLSFLVAIDLYYIYLNDKELAFYLLKNIRYIKNEDNIFQVLRTNHITFMDDGYDNLKKYTKKIERQN